MRLVCLADLSVAPGGLAYRAVETVADRAPGRLTLSPADATACATALTIKRERPETGVAVVALGPAGAAPGLAALVRLGVDQVTLLADPAFAGSDSTVRSRILAAHLRTARPDLVLTGSRTADGALAEVAPQVAELLGLPYVPEVDRVDVGTLAAGAALVDVTAGRWVDTYRVTLPAILGLRHQHGQTLPHPRLRDATADVGDRVQVLDARALGLAPHTVGAGASRTTVAGAPEPLAPHPAPLVVACDAEGIEQVHAFLRRQGLA